MKRALYGGLIVLTLASVCPVYAQLQLPTCEQFKAGYDLLSSQSFSAEDGSLEIAAKALADNHLIYSDATQTGYASREQLVAYFSSLQSIDALIWLQERYTDIENRLRSGACPFEAKRLVLRAPKYVPKPNEKSCGGSLPNLSNQLAK